MLHLYKLLVKIFGLALNLRCQKLDLRPQILYFCLTMVHGCYTIIHICAQFSISDIFQTHFSLNFLDFIIKKIIILDGNFLMIRKLVINIHKCLWLISPLKTTRILKSLHPLFRCFHLQIDFFLSLTVSIQIFKTDSEHFLHCSSCPCLQCVELNIISIYLTFFMRLRHI